MPDIASLDRAGLLAFLRADEALRRRQEKRAAEESLYTFVALMWHAVEPETPFVGGWVLEAECRHLEAVTDGELTRLLMNVPPGSTKALDDDTPVLTTWGWKRHGDLVADDFVFGADGMPKRVIAVTGPWETECFAVGFDDGAEIVAAGDHLWAIERDVMSVAPRYSRGRKAMVVATSDLRTTDPQNGWSRRPDRIAMATPVSLPPKRLMIGPYLLGAWLGDGHTNSGSLSASEEDIAHFRQLGRIGTVYEPSGTRRQRFYRITIECLETRLRLMGLRGNKHIPDDYLEASIEQRWELLRGLMDTDGCATAAGNCTFVTKLERLGQQVLQLARSLGLKATLRETWSVLNGVRHGPYYQLAFTPPTGARIFNLERKQSRVRGNQNGKSRYRYVTSLTEVPKRSVRCIQVEGNIYLVGKAFVPTHNSLLTSVFWPAFEWGPRRRPHLRYLCCAYAGHLTLRDNRRFKSVIEDEVYQRYWGNVFRPRADMYSTVQVGNDKTGWKLASSVGGVGTGERADRVIIDDPNNPLEVESELIMKSTTTWFREVMPDRLNSLEKSAIVVIQQRTHDLDVSGTILELGLPYCHLSIPMRFDVQRRVLPTDIGWVDPRALDEHGDILPELNSDGTIVAGSLLAEQDGILAWPERFSAEAILELENAKGSYAFSSQYQMLPVPRGQGIIPEHYWQLWAREEFPEYGTCIAALDTAYEEHAEADYNALTVWAAFEDPESGRPKVMLRDAWQIRCKLAELVKRVIAICREHKVDVLLIEKKTRGTDVRDEIERLTRGREFAMELILPSGDKVSRLNACQAVFENRVIYAPDRDWADMVIRQVAAFPYGRHDDLVDTVSMSLIWLRANGVAVRREEHDMAINEHRRYQKPLPALYDV